MHREADLMRYSYDTLKSNATRRGKPFELTFEEFKMFCYLTAYHIGKGRTKVSYTVDCIINELGYIASNIRSIPKGENSRKGTKTLVYDWEYPEYAHYK